MIIRDSILEDSDAIREVSKITWLDTYPNVEYDITVNDILSVYPDIPVSSEIIKKRAARYANPNMHIWVAEAEGGVVGFCSAVKEEKVNRIMAIYVLPKYHGTGTGKKLINQAFNWLGNEKDILVNVVKYNNHAIGFYEHVGFVKTDIEGVFDDIARLPTGKVIPELQMILRFT